MRRKLFSYLKGPRVYKNGSNIGVRKEPGTSMRIDDMRIQKQRDKADRKTAESLSKFDPNTTSRPVNKESIMNLLNDSRLNLDNSIVRMENDGRKVPDKLRKLSDTLKEKDKEVKNLKNNSQRSLFDTGRHKN